MRTQLDMLACIQQAAEYQESRVTQQIEYHYEHIAISDTYIFINRKKKSAYTNTDTFIHSFIHAHTQAPAQAQNA